MKNDMKRNAGMYKPNARADQRGDGADFAFNGQMGDGVNRSSETHRYSGNQSGLMMRENFGNGPRTASENSQAAMHDHGTPVTKDRYRTAPDTAKGGVLGKRSWEPKMGSNYVGNADKINVGMK
jgi:hypothetical protein